MDQPDTTPEFHSHATTQHGVMLRVFNSGILITGAAGIGKSELALALIQNGHVLIADDVAQLQRHLQQIQVHCPPLLQNMLNVYGLGILDIRAMYGDTATARLQRLDLILHLTDNETYQNSHADPSRAHYTTRTLLGLAVPQLFIPINSRRNGVAVVEAAVQNHVLLQNGYDAREQFVIRQQRTIKNTQS